MAEKRNYEPAHWDRLFATPGILAVITTVDGQGRVNAAAFATCVRAVHQPLQISFVTYAEGTQTYRNICETGQFVVNLPGFRKELLEKVCTVGLPFDQGVNEIEQAGLTALPATRVGPPRIAECGRHFECELVWTKEWLGRVVIMGNVVAASADDGSTDQEGFIDWDAVTPALYCGSTYFRAPDYQHSFVGNGAVVAVSSPYEGPEAQHYRDTVGAASRR
jgi:flavin reductase (DIM6/NTAB) family NADH-FMN oxidoreductase RutF